jgi:hypothetical protein
MPWTAIDSPTWHQEAIGKELEGRFTELDCPDPAWAAGLGWSPPAGIEPATPS